MIQAYPPSPAPFYSYLLYFYAQFFYIIYLIYFSSWISNRLGPCVVFVTHKNTRKSHIIKTHNCCESIKRELKRKKNQKQFLEFVGKCTVHQCFYFTTRWWVHRVPSSIGCVVDWTFPRLKCNQTKFTKYTLHRPVSSSGWQRWENIIKKKKFYRTKINYSSWNPLFL